MNDGTPQLDKHPQPLQPSFWIVVVAAGIQVTPLHQPANIEFYQSRCVAYTKQEAIQATLKQLQAEVPALWDRGQQIGGWRVTHVDGIPATDMEKLFTERCDIERQKEATAVKAEQNVLLQQIVSTKDVNLFHRAIRDGRINAYERAYLHEKLTEGMPTDVEEMIVSPYPRI